MLLTEIEKIENGRIFTKDDSLFECPHCKSTFAKNFAKDKMRRWGKDKQFFYTTKHCPNCDKRIMLRDDNPDIESVNTRLSKLRTYCNYCKMNGQFDEYRDAMSETLELQKQIEDMRNGEMKSKVKDSQIWSKNGIVVNEEKDSEGTYYTVINTKTGEHVGDYDNESLAIAAAKNETSSRDATNWMGERTFQTYEAWKRACKQIDPNVKFDGDKDICQAGKVGEWDGEKGIIYNTKDRKTKDAMIKYKGFSIVEDMNGLFMVLKDVGKYYTIEQSLEAAKDWIDDYLKQTGQSNDSKQLMKDAAAVALKGLDEVRKQMKDRKTKDDAKEDSLQKRIKDLQDYANRSRMTGDLEEYKAAMKEIENLKREFESLQKGLPIKDKRMKDDSPVYRSGKYEIYEDGNEPKDSRFLVFVEGNHRAIAAVGSLNAAKEAIKRDKDVYGANKYNPYNTTKDKRIKDAAAVALKGLGEVRKQMKDGSLMEKYKGYEIWSTFGGVNIKDDRGKVFNIASSGDLQGAILKAKSKIDKLQMMEAGGPFPISNDSKPTAKDKLLKDLDLLRKDMKRTKDTGKVEVKRQSDVGSNRWGIYVNGKLVEGGFFSKEVAEENASKNYGGAKDTALRSLDSLKRSVKRKTKDENEEEGLYYYKQWRVYGNNGKWIATRKFLGKTGSPGRGEVKRTAKSFEEAKSKIDDYIRQLGHDKKTKDINPPSESERIKNDFESGRRDHNAGYYDKWYRWNRKDSGKAYDDGFNSVAGKPVQIIEAMHDSKKTKDEDNDKIEAYGIKGNNNTRWRRIFNNRAEMMKWVESNNAEIQGTRKAEPNERVGNVDSKPTAKDKLLKDLDSLKRRVKDAFGMNTEEQQKEFDTRNIEEETIKNNAFRRVVFTGNTLQLVLMSLLPNEDIGMEVHDNVDQFFRIEEGEGLLEIEGQGSQPVKAGFSILITAGTKHNVKNIGSEPLKLYTIYGPPNHPPDRLQNTKAEAIEAEKVAVGDKKTKDQENYKVYWVNHNYYSQEEFNTLEEARKYADSKSFEYRIDLNGRPVASGGSLRGFRMIDKKTKDVDYKSKLMELKGRLLEQRTGGASAIEIRNTLEEIKEVESIIRNNSSKDSKTRDYVSSSDMYSVGFKLVKSEINGEGVEMDWFIHPKIKDHHFLLRDDKEGILIGQGSSPGGGIITTVSTPMAVFNFLKNYI